MPTLRNTVGEPLPSVLSQGPQAGHLGGRQEGSPSPSSWVTRRGELQGMWGRDEEQTEHPEPSTAKPRLTLTHHQPLRTRVSVRQEGRCSQATREAERPEAVSLGRPLPI